MKKIFSVSALIFSFLIFNSASGQTSVTAGPEQKIKAEMKVPSAVRPGSEFTVEIKIMKGSLSGLGRFQQFLPMGMTATAIENGGADFSFENQNVKFIWLSLPQDATLSVKYKITLDASLRATKTLSGTFSYVENGRTKTFMLPPKEIFIDANAPAEEPAAQQADRIPEPPRGEAAPVVVETKPEITSEPVPAPNAKDEKPVEEKQAVSQPVAADVPAANEMQSDSKPIGSVTEKKEPVPASLSNTATENSGIIFRVQIVAMNEKRFRKDGHFQKKFGLEQTVYTEEHDGLKKYSVGNFATYTEAHSFRDEIISKAEGCFVVAYKDGVRISVAEAIVLMKNK